MVDAREPLPKIGEVEMAALQHLWAVGEADVAETHVAVGHPRGISANTVGSALERLYKKALVRRQKVSHAYRYQAALSEDEFAARRVLEATAGRAALSRAGLLSAFVDLVAEVDEDLLDQLADLVDEKRGGA